MKQQNFMLPNIKLILHRVEDTSLGWCILHQAGAGDVRQKTLAKITSLLDNVSPLIHEAAAAVSGKNCFILDAQASVIADPSSQQFYDRRCSQQT